MGRDETGRAHSAAGVLKKALPGTVSQLLTLGIVAVIGLSVWGIWYSWDAYQHWNRHVRNHPVTWLDGRLFTDLDMQDYMQAASDGHAMYALIHIKFLLHLGHELGVIRDPESLRVLRRSFKQARTFTMDGETSALLRLAEAMVESMDERMPRVDNPHEENLCLWMYSAIQRVAKQYPEDFHDVYDHWLNPRLGSPAMWWEGDPGSPYAGKNSYDICHQP